MPTSSRKPKAKKVDDGLCDFNHAMKIRITQQEARCIAHGNFLPRSVADKMIADIEAMYSLTESREKIARMVDPLGVL